jgi:hypothetical protein
MLSSAVGAEDMGLIGCRDVTDVDECRSHWIEGVGLSEGEGVGVAPVGQVVVLGV